MSNANKMVKELLRLGTYLQREGARVTREFGLTQQQFVILVAIKEQGPISQKGITSELLYEKSSVSKCVTRLLSLELVKISRDKDDSRVAICRITDKGRDVVEKCMNIMKFWNDDWLQSIPDSELHNVVKILETIGPMK